MLFIKIEYVLWISAWYMKAFEKSTRSGNDASNKARELLLSTLLESSFQDDSPERGLQDDLRRALDTVATHSGIQYTSVTMVHKGGRTHNYDFDALYTGPEGVTSRKIEFKYGCSSIPKLPQFLSLSVKQFLPEFISFWWNHLDQYTTLDEGITLAKPSLEEYSKAVCSIHSNVPFLVQLKEREVVFKKEKHKVVNDCITAFLQQAPTFSYEFIQERLRSQQEKYFLCWNRTMTVDFFTDAELSNLQYHSVTKNCILLQSDGAIFSLLLRWRNHKGILNPAWQISVKRKIDIQTNKNGS